MALGLRSVFLIAGFIVAAPSLAHAACSSPSGVKGEFFYNDDFAVLQFCNGTDWIGMYGGSGGGGTGVTDGDKGDLSVSGSGANWMIDDDALDFTEFKDALALDASTDIAISGTQVLSLTNTGTGNSFVVGDQASDTTPFVIDAAGNVGIGLATPTQALDVVGKTTSNSFIVKPQTGLAAPSGGLALGWSTDGTHVWRATGRVGIGTAAPSYSLDIVGSGIQVTAPNTSTSAFIGTAIPAGSTSTARFQATLGGSGTWYWGLDGADASKWKLAANSFTFANPAVTVTTAGNVGIGTASPGVKFEVAGDVMATGSGDVGASLTVQNTSKTAANAARYWRLYNMTGGYANSLQFWAYDTTGCSGGMCAPRLALGDLGDMTLGQGTAYKPGGGSWAATSDARLKDVDGPYERGLDAIARLDTVRFHYKKDNARQEPSDRPFVGLIAQDVQKVFPEAVTTGKDGYLSLETTAINFALINAVKELKAANDNLRAEHDAELRALRAEIEALKAARH